MGLPPITLDRIAADQAPVLRNLFELYAHDFSEFVPLELDANGRFEAPLGQDWWGGDDRFPFFIRSKGKLSGFALVKMGSRLTLANDVMDVAEFFVVRGARGQKIGTSAAHALFTAFPGKWEIRVKPTNLPALKFWSRAVATWLGQPIASESISSQGVDWEVFRIAYR